MSGDNTTIVKQITCTPEELMAACKKAAENVTKWPSRKQAVAPAEDEE